MKEEKKILFLIMKEGKGFIIKCGDNVDLKFFVGDIGSIMKKGSSMFLFFIGSKGKIMKILGGLSGLDVKLKLFIKMLLRNIFFLKMRVGGLGKIMKRR